MKNIGENYYIVLPCAVKSEHDGRTISVPALSNIRCFKTCESDQLLCSNLKNKRKSITNAQGLEGRRSTDLCEITYENRRLEI